MLVFCHFVSCSFIAKGIERLLDTALCCIIEDLLKKRNAMVLTAEELTQLKVDISRLLLAASPCHTCDSHQRQLLGIKG